VIGSILLPMAAAVALLAALLVGFSYVRARVLLTPRRTLPSLPPADLGLSVEDVRIPGPRGSLAAWYLPATNGCTLICCHGIHDNRGQWLDQVARLHARSGYGAVLFDFSGHGESDGRLVTYGARETLDVAAVLAYLQERGDVDMTRIGILGYSLGAITAILAAADISELACVVVESGFADVHRDLGVLFRRYLGLPSFPFANLIVFFGELMSGVRLAEIRPVRVIGRISPRAVLIIADLKDELANEPYDGEHLYAAAGEPKQLWQVADAHHVRAFQLMPDEWIARVGGFLDDYLASLPATPLLATRSQTPPRPER
jgi:uncharacterized protein